MLDADERQQIIITVLDMLKEQIAAPTERIFLALIFELMAESSVDHGRLAERLEAQWECMPEYEKESIGGTVLLRLQRLLALLRDDPEQFLAYASGTDEQPARVPPEWLRGVIQGGKGQSDPE